jgi:hypothetical protein
MLRSERLLYVARVRKTTHFEFVNIGGRCIKYGVKIVRKTKRHRKGDTVSSVGIKCHNAYR